MLYYILYSIQRRRKIILLTLGIITTVIGTLLFKKNEQTENIFSFMIMKLFSYFVILSIVAIIISAICRNVRKYWFSVLAWLFLIAGVFDTVAGGIDAFILQPRIKRASLNDYHFLNSHTAFSEALKISDKAGGVFKMSAEQKAKFASSLRLAIEEANLVKTSNLMNAHPDLPDIFANKYMSGMKNMLEGIETNNTLLISSGGTLCN